MPLFNLVSNKFNNYIDNNNKKNVINYYLNRNATNL